jgi:hypothetical protein
MYTTVLPYNAILGKDLTEDNGEHTPASFHSAHDTYWHLPSWAPCSAAAETNYGRRAALRQWKYDRVAIKAISLWVLYVASSAEYFSAPQVASSPVVCIPDPWDPSLLPHNVHARGCHGWALDVVRRA